MLSVLQKKLSLNYINKLTYFVSLLIITIYLNVRFPPLGQRAELFC